MKNIKKQVQKFKKEFKLTGVPDLSELKQAVRNLNYDLTTYRDGADLLKETHMTDAAQIVPALTVRTPKAKCILYNGNIQEKDLPFILAHEIGHIYLNHIRTSRGYYDTSEYRDNEANCFAVYLMGEISSKKYWIPTILSLLIAFVTIISAVALFAQNETLPPSEKTNEIAPSILVTVPVETNKKIITKTPEVTPAPTQKEPAEIPIDEIVIITRTGKRFHKEDCHTIKKSTGLKSATVAEAAELGLTPCAYCFK